MASVLTGDHIDEQMVAGFRLMSSPCEVVVHVTGSADLPSIEQQGDIGRALSSAEH